MRILIASDTHGRTDKLKELRMRVPADQYWFAGDLCDAPEQAAGWRLVRGNNDHWLGRNLPDIQKATIAGHNILMTHGHLQGTSARRKRLASLGRDNGCDIVIYGHSHRPEITREGDVLLLNPGSLSRPRSQEGCTYMILDITPEHVQPRIISEKENP